MNIFFSIIGPLTVILILLAVVFLWYNDDTQTTKAFTVWLIFTVTIALMPIAFNIIVSIFVVESSLNMSTILAQGDLLIVSVAVGSDSIGRILSSRNQRHVAKIIAAGTCLLLVIFSSLLFAYVSNPSTKVNVIIEHVAIISSSIFFMTVMTCGSSVLLCEV